MQKQIVIEIDEDRYSFINSIKDGVSDYQTSMMLYNAIRNGTVLPKHGRLIDADSITKDDNTFCKSFERVTDTMTGRSAIVCTAPTILEATE